MLTYFMLALRLPHKLLHSFTYFINKLRIRYNLGKAIRCDQCKDSPSQIESFLKVYLYNPPIKLCEFRYFWREGYLKGYTVSAALKLANYLVDQSTIVDSYYLLQQWGTDFIVFLEKKEVAWMIVVCWSQLQNLSESSY